MPEILDHVAYLSQEIGPRPAGTEEEQQAALYITENMQKEAGLSAVIEDFGGVSAADLPRVICCACSLVIAGLALFVPVLGVASILVTLVAALLFVAEAFDRPLLSKLFGRGVSQNVVAKYEPGYSAEAGNTRRRKVILVSRYDSGKVQKELIKPLVPLLHAIQWATLGAMVALPLLLVLLNVVFLNATGVIAIVLNVLIVVALVLVAIPLLIALLHKLAAYNEGANCNASGTAVLLEVARRVGRGRMSEDDLARQEEAVLHGEEAARAAGLIPEGAALAYEAQALKAPEPAFQTPEMRLASAKAAVAALTGSPVSGALASDIAQNLVQVKEPPVPRPTEESFHDQRDATRAAFGTIPPDTIQVALANAENGVPSQDEYVDAGIMADEAAVMASQAVLSPASSGGVPDWFKKAQEKAKKPRVVEKPVQRSRYASALDAAVEESAGHFAEANSIVDQKLEERLGTGRDEIREVKAPQWSAPVFEAPGQNTPSSSYETSGTYCQPNTDEGAAAASSAAVIAEQPYGDEGAFETVDTHNENAVDLSATTAMPPLDVSSLSLEDIPQMRDLPMPSFLDPRKAQEAALAARQAQQRTGNRIDVTDATLDSSGRIEPVASFDERIVAGADAENDVSAVRRPIVLPDIGMGSAKLTPITEMTKQRAPLADVESSGKTAAKSLLTMLPSINVAEDRDVDSLVQEDGSAPTESDVVTSKASSLRSMLPSLSGALGHKETPEGKTSNVSAAGSFMPAGATGAFAPVGDELLDNVDPDDIYVEDADDSGYGENYTETGAFAGPGYVDMPKSRMRRLFDRFRKKGNAEEESPQEWLDVDETFDARKVGAQRGGWESFQEEGAVSADPAATTRFEPYEAYDGVEDDSYEEEYLDVGDQQFEPIAYRNDDAFDVDDIDDFGPDERPRRWHGGAFSVRHMEQSNLDSRAVAEEAASAAAGVGEVAEELKQVYQFRNPDVNVEVWFVALGSETAANGGMRAFLAEHQQDLRGSVIIDLDGLGAGDLCMVEQEGCYKSVKTSSRMKRYVKKATQATGQSVGSARLTWKESASSFAIRHGFQAMHLVGMDGPKPAYFAQGDDVLENISEDTLEANADYIMELLKNI